MYSGPSPTGMSISKNYYWKLSLGPNESKSISYSEIYWPSYAVILLGIVAAFIFYIQMSAFSITKNVISGTRVRPGKEISVALNLKNRKNEIDRAVVRDVVPPNYSIVSKFETVKPVIRKIGEGIELNWKVSKLKPQEERVFHYTIKPIEPGEGRLPSARVRAVHQDKLVQKSSNKISLSPELEADVVRVKVKKD
jgi:uncharacterized protein (DUF58 family)